MKWNICRSFVQYIYRCFKLKQTWLVFFVCLFVFLICCIWFLFLYIYFICFFLVSYFDLIITHSTLHCTIQSKTIDVWLWFIVTCTNNQTNDLLSSPVSNRKIKKKLFVQLVSPTPLTFIGYCRLGMIRSGLLSSSSSSNIINCTIHHKC